MGSPISNTLVEIYLQFFEELTIRHWMENGEIPYYRRHVDDVIIIFDQNKINKVLIAIYMKNTHNYFEFKLTEEENNKVTYLDFSIHKKNELHHLGVQRKPSQTDATIHFTINNQLEHKPAAYNFYINRMKTLPITQQTKQPEWNTILTVAKNNGFPLQIICKPKKK
jgi:hypothetical protein